MKFYILAYSVVLIYFSYSPVWTTEILIGQVKNCWIDDTEYQNLGILTKVENNNEYKIYVNNIVHTFGLIDFSAQINNLVYLNTVNQNEFITLAFDSIIGVHNMFLNIYPDSHSQSDDVLVLQVALQLSNGELKKVAEKAAFDLHPFKDGVGIRFVLHSRISSKLPITIFDSREFGVRFILNSLFIILAVQPTDENEEVFYYGLEFPNKSELRKFENQSKSEWSRGLCENIPEEFENRIRAFMKGKTIPPLKEPLEPLYKHKGIHVIGEIVA